MEYVIQPNAISQSIYSCSTNARRLLAMAMAQLKEGDDLTVSFSLLDFIKALGLEDGDKTRRLLQAAALECTRNLIEIHLPDDVYKIYTWFSSTTLSHHVSPAAAPGFDKKSAQNLKKELCGPSTPWDTITMTFNRELADAIMQFKKAYAKIELADLGKLQSRYAIRFYELALSYAGFAGKGGNRTGEWYFDHTLDELRALFQVDPKKYKVTKDFRVYIIDKPIEEINAAHLGLQIEPEYARRGKWLIGARFWCRWVKRGEPVPVNPATETGQEEDRLIAAFPGEYEALEAEERARIKQQPGLFKDYPQFEEMAAKGQAAIRLREAHPDFFKKKGGKK